MRSANPSPTRPFGPRILLVLLALVAATAFSPPASAQDEDEAYQLYLEARELLNEGEYSAAARRYEDVVRQHEDSEYAAKALYWKAFALSREGGRRDLRAAMEALQQQYDRYRDEATRGDSAELAIRIRTRLAELGDARAAEELALLEQRLAEESGSGRERDRDRSRAEGGLDQEERLMALNALLQMRPERALPILKKILVEHPDEYGEEFRAKAVFMVAQHAEGDEAIDMLLQVIHDDPDREVRAQAVFWLGQTDEDRAFEVLKGILNDPEEDIEIQDKAIFAISQYGGTEAAEVLRDVAADTEAEREIRAQAIFWLHQVDSRESERFLIDLYGQLSDEELKDKVIFSIAQLDGRSAGDFLRRIVRDTDESVDMRKNALFWLGQTDEVDVEDLRALYHEVDDIEMREHVIFVLSQVDDDAALNLLIEIARSDDDPDLREKAIFWIGQSDSDRAADFLEEMLGEW